MFRGNHAFNFVCESKKIAAARFSMRAHFQNGKDVKHYGAAFDVYGDKDKAIPIDLVRELESTLKKLKKNTQFEIYSGAGHAFCSETGPNYNEEAATDAWEKAIKFFGTYLPVPKV